MRMNRIVSLAAVLVLALVAGAPGTVAQAQQPDLTGTWNMDAEVNLPVEQPALQDGAASKGVVQEPDCIYQGRAEITDNGGQLSGQVDLVLVEGLEDCPVEMMATLQDATASTGEAMGSLMVSGVLDGGQMFGTASFSGSISTNPGGSGTLSVSSGPFAGGSGGWMVQLQQSVLEIPTVSAVGLVLLTVLILASGTLVLRHVASA